MDMNEKQNSSSYPSELSSDACPCLKTLSTRRDFLSLGRCCITTALALYGFHVDAVHALAVTGTQTPEGQGSMVDYPLPTADGISIDRENQVILVRSEMRIFAFALACPHENTALRWREKDRRFQCPRHESKYRPDGVFLSGRATRNMDRFAIRRDGQKAMVSLAQLFRADNQKTEWESAVILL
jgi:nitrite reductase/ring-hydroxylating ferredoxin subunit